MQKLYIKSYILVSFLKTKSLGSLSMLGLAFQRLGLLDFNVNIKLYFVAKQSKLKSLLRTSVKRLSNSLSLIIKI